ncbi:MAG: exodeoxyribonuclease VII large subunit [Clostridiales bacterium]|nr:exodeoxyribonuclease VII large subunit [Clostridiales bacterium]
MAWTLSVTELNEYVRRSLASDPMLRSVVLRGEISNFKKHFSGHWYFSLKDEKSRIDCVMFRQNNLGVRFEPKDGARVQLGGTVGLYTAAGSYQFYAESMQPDGVGDLYLRFEQLKAKLLAEGLFDSARKRPLPLLPRAIGIVTSNTGAVVHDIARVAGRRNPGMQLVLRPAQVQGEGAAQDIVKGIEELSRVEGIDVIIIGRGGGSLEDLWAFNEEIVARAIAACPVPVISAVGHETDVAISDFVADHRAATPSAAAEIAVAERSVLLSQAEDIKTQLQAALARKILAGRAELAETGRRLRACHPLAKVREMQLTLTRLSQRLNRQAESAVNNSRGRLDVLRGKLEALGPAGALERGYAIPRISGRVIRGADEVAPGDEIDLLVKGGEIAARVTEIRRSSL